MKLVEVNENLDYVALPSVGEDEESRAAYLAQVLAEAGNPGEWVVRRWIRRSDCQLLKADAEDLRT